MTDNSQWQAPGGGPAAPPPYGAPSASPSHGRRRGRPAAGLDAAAQTGADPAAAAGPRHDPRRLVPGAAPQPEADLRGGAAHPGRVLRARARRARTGHLPVAEPDRLRRRRRQRRHPGRLRRRDRGDQPGRGAVHDRHLRAAAGHHRARGVPRHPRREAHAAAAVAAGARQAVGVDRLVAAGGRRDRRRGARAGRRDRARRGHPRQPGGRHRGADRHPGRVRAAGRGHLDRHQTHPGLQRADDRAAHPRARPSPAPGGSPRARSGARSASSCWWR